MLDKYPYPTIANVTRASQGLAQQSVATPAPNQQIPGVSWKSELWREPGFQAATNMAPYTQSDNYFTKNEGWQQVKNGIFNQPTGKEPIYGSVNFELNPLDQGQTSREVFALNGMTRAGGACGNKNPFKFMWRTASLYPANGGQPNYMNFQGKQPVR